MCTPLMKKCMVKTVGCHVIRQVAMATALMKSLQNYDFTIDSERNHNNPIKFYSIKSSLMGYHEVQLEQKCLL